MNNLAICENTSEHFGKLGSVPFFCYNRPKCSEKVEVNSLGKFKIWLNKQIKHNKIKAKKESDTSFKDNFIFNFNVIYRVIQSLLLLMIVVFLLLGALGLGIGTGYFASLVADTNILTKAELDKDLNDYEQVSNLTYANGQQIASIKSDLLRTNVSSEEISPYLKSAIIATEDEYFEKHDGIVPKALIRAVISDMTGLGGSSGGSTLTQQLVKQQILTDDPTFKRKANEILLALRVEKFYSKDEIITTYLNVSPFGRNNKGQNIAGVEQAAQGIFGVSAKDLTLPQAAFIAGLPQSPISYSPYTNTGALKEDLQAGLDRKDFVLFSMYREKKISKKEYDEAVAVDLVAQFKPQESSETDQNGFLYHYILEEATNVLAKQLYTADGKKESDLDEAASDRYYELASRKLRRSGYTVQTTISESIYNEMQNAVANYGSIIDDGRGSQVETGSVLMENSTGKILGFIGGRDYATNQNNHAFDTRRSPGSTMKPILAYAPAIDTGLIGSETKLSNYPTKYSNGTPLTNYGGVSGNDFESVREALRKSDNIPVYYLYQKLLATADPKVYVQKMNLELSDNEIYHTESIPLGGTDYGLTVSEQTNAYATLANQGVYNEGYSIEKITDNAGNVIYQHQSSPTEVFSKATASIMNDMMREVVNSGTATAAKTQLSYLSTSLSSGDWVGKTGTSQTNGDYWFTASTPAVTLSSWIGYDDNTEMSAGNGKANMRLWAYIANAAYQSDPAVFGVDQRFTLDSSVIKSQVSDFTGEKNGNVTVDGTSIKVPGSTITSLFAKSGAIASQYKFGIGGTDAIYKSKWDSYLEAAKKTASDEKNATTPSTTPTAPQTDNKAAQDEPNDANNADNNNENDDANAD